MTDASGLDGVRLGTATGRAVVTAAVLGSGMTMLDGTVVNVALATIGEDLDASLAQLQWITNGYLLSLASLILLGGSLGDRYGRRRIFVIGTVWFALASVLCGLAPNPTILIAARILQGAGAALLTPGSLAMIQGAFVRGDRAKAIGAWVGLGGIASAIGPFVGGFLVEYADWRWIFLINLPIAAVTVVVAMKAVPETLDPHAPRRLDFTGAVLATLFLGGLTYALIDWGGAVAPWAFGVSILAAIGYVVDERRSEHPMLPLGIFADRTFSAANAMTLVVYAALGAVLFFLVLQLQTVSGYGALEAGMATLPITVCILLLASKGGELGTRIGPRIPMTVGPIVMAGGSLLLLGVGPDVNYWTQVFPGLTIFGLGLALMVAPLTATVLAAAADEHAGIASGVNNAVARAGSLLAVAALPVAVGLTGEQYADPVAFDAAYGSAIAICAVLLAIGGLLSWVTIRNPGSRLQASGAHPETSCIMRNKASLTPTLVRLLGSVRYEVLPTAATEDKVLAHVPRDVTITVTASPSKGLGATLDLAERLAGHGYTVVPHVAARMVSGRAELEEICGRLTGKGITRVFVPGGDAEPAGDYADALSLLLDLAALGRPFEQVGITGYPESHPTIHDDLTVQSMWDKRRYATHVVSNLTFDPALIRDWVHRLRGRGVTMPLLLGIPGPVDRTKLLTMATKIGVGESTRFLAKHKGTFARLAAPGGFTGERFLEQCAPTLADPTALVEGLHVFTFNQLAETEAWRQGLLDRLRG